MPIPEDSAEFIELIFRAMPDELRIAPDRIEPLGDALTRIHKLACESSRYNKYDFDALSLGLADFCVALLQSLDGGKLQARIEWCFLTIHHILTVSGFELRNSFADADLDISYVRQRFFIESRSYFPLLGNDSAASSHIANFLRGCYTKSSGPEEKLRLTGSLVTIGTAALHFRGKGGAKSPAPKTSPAVTTPAPAELAEPQPLTHSPNVEAVEAAAKPTLQENATVLSDCRWALQQWQSGAFDQYNEDFVFILNEKVIGTGPDRNNTRRELAQTSGVPLNRIVVCYKGPYQ